MDANQQQGRSGAEVLFTERAVNSSFHEIQEYHVLYAMQKISGS